MLLTGLRGVGKTVLLNEIERLASADDYRTIQIEGLRGRLPHDSDRGTRG